MIGLGIGAPYIPSDLLVSLLMVSCFKLSVIVLGLQGFSVYALTNSPISSSWATISIVFPMSEENKS
jgi:hypothetical protein